jgi:predicted  nucleic acid-binding Zn-ribbon protein
MTALAQKTKEASDLGARLADTEVKLAALEGSFATLSTELEQTRSTLANDQGTLGRARGKWQGDRASLERTKDALAAALAQIDEIEGRTFE